jgi:primosomal protein N'
MSEENVGMMNWLTIWGHRNLLGLICYPKWSRLDPAIKDFVHFRIHIPIRGVAIWYDVFHPDRAKDAVLIERFRFRFDDLPEGEFKRAYQEKKTAFTKKESKSPKDGRSKLTDKQRRIMVWLVTKQGKSHKEVAEQFKVSRPYVTQLVKASGG